MDTTTSTDDYLPRDVIDALLTWTPAKGLLADDPRVKAWVGNDPKRSEAIRKLTLFLLRARLGSG